MLKTLRDKGVNLNIRFGVERQTILHLAVIAQDEPVLRYLISKSDADINDKDIAVRKTELFNDLEYFKY